MTTPVSSPDTVVLDDESPGAHCPYCERPFDTDRSCALHVGEAHNDEWTAQEQDAYEEAKTAEDSELWVYHMKVVIGLGITHGAIILAYMVVLG